MEKVTVRIRGLEGVLDMLNQLPKEMVSSRGGVVLSGLRKGGAIVKNAWKAEVQRIIDEPNQDAADRRSTGLYKRSIVAARMRDPKKEGADEGMRVRVKQARYKGGKTTGLVAGVLEHGTETMRAFAPMRKAFTASSRAALQAAVESIEAGAKKAIAKLDKNNG